VIDLIECQDLKVHQEEHKSNQVAEKHLEHKEQAPPTSNGIVECRANKRESVAMFPVTGGAVLVDWHKDSDAPGPALKPVKELHVWRPHPTTVLVRYNICHKNSARSVSNNGTSDSCQSLELREKNVPVKNRK